MTAVLINFIFATSLIVCINALAVSSWLKHVDQESQLCSSPDGIPFQYTGFRVYQVYMFAWPARHFWHIAKCYKGALVEHQFFPANSTSNFMFGQSLCLSKHECYLIARRRKFAPRNSPIFRPYATVGGIFKHDPNTNATDFLGIMKSDNMGASVTLTSGLLSRMRFTPVLFSPDGLLTVTSRTSLDISPYEDYNFTSADMSKPWWAINELVNTLVAKVRIDESYLPWEFDALQQHLCEEMGWRERVNTAMAKFENSFNANIGYE